MAADLWTVIAQQREAALNALAQAHVQIAALKEHIAALEQGPAADEPGDESGQTVKATDGA